MSSETGQALDLDRMRQELDAQLPLHEQVCALRAVLKDAREWIERARGGWIGGETDRNILHRIELALKQTGGVDAVWPSK